MMEALLQTFGKKVGSPTKMQMVRLNYVTFQTFNISPLSLHRNKIKPHELFLVSLKTHEGIQLSKRCQLPLAITNADQPATNITQMTTTAWFTITCVW